MHKYKETEYARITNNLTSNKSKKRTPYDLESHRRRLCNGEALFETIDILGDNEILQALKASQSDFKSGRIYTHDETWKE